MTGETASGNRDGRALAAGDLAEQAAELAGLIHTIRPQVIVTYNERGGSGRPDHIRAHDITLAAVDAARPDWPVARVYAAVVPRSAILRGAELLAGSPMSGENPLAGVADPQILPFFVADEDVSAAVDARAYAAHKIGRDAGASDPDAAGCLVLRVSRRHRRPVRHGALPAAARRRPGSGRRARRPVRRAAQVAHGMTKWSLKRRPSHGRRPQASTPPRSSARPIGSRP